MNQIQIKRSSAKELLVAFKNKARCFYCQPKSNSIYKELRGRLGDEPLSEIRTAWFHMMHGEGDSEFNKECDKIIERL